MSNNDYHFSPSTFVLFLCASTVIGFLLFILGYQIGRVRGIQTEPPSVFDNSHSSSSDQIVAEVTPVPFKSESLSFYKTVHRATPIALYDQNTAVAEKPTPRTQISPTQTPVSKPTPLLAVAGRFTIQVASFSELSKAENLAATLKKHDFPAYVSPYPQPDGQKVYRVRVGHFSDKNSATQISARIKEKENLDTWVTPED